MTTTSAATAAPLPPAPLPRRSFLHLAGAGLATGAMLPAARFGRDDDTSSGTSRTTLRLVRQLFVVIQTRDTAAIWSMFASDGSVEFPFLGLRFTDFGSFDAGVGPLLAALDGLTYTDPTFLALADPYGVIAKYRGHATITVTGKPYDQTYITEVHVRHGKIASYAEYFDTAVLNEAFTP